MPRSAPALLLLLAACAPAQTRTGLPPGGEPLRLCVENATSGYGNVEAQANSVRFVVAPGETLCRAVGVASATIPLRAGTTSGGIGGRLAFENRLDPMHQRCWHWRLSNTRESSLDLRPCVEPQR